MKKLLMLGSSPTSVELLKLAKAQGIYTITTDYWEPEHSEAKQISDEYWMISTGDLEKLTQKCREENVQAVISGVSDFNTGMAVKLCDELDLPCFCTEAVWNNSRDKVLFKQLARESSVPVPTDYILSSQLTQEELSSIVYPVVVKPIDLCANKGISFCFNQNELIEAYRYAESLSDRKEIVVERMISGVELFCYYALADGEAAFLTLGTRLSQPGESKFCYSMSFTPSRFTGKYLNELNESVINLLKKIGCHDGIACVQCMWDEQDDRIYAFEMCYSSEGSLLITSLKQVCGFDALKWQLDCALGVKHSPSQLSHIGSTTSAKYANSYILFCNKTGILTNISNFEPINELPNAEVHIDKRIGDTISIYPVGDVRFYTDNVKDTCNIIRRINDTLHVENENGEDVLIHFTDFDTLKREYADSKDPEIR